MEKKLTCEEIVVKLDYMKRFLEMSSEEVVACIGDCVNLSQKNIDYYLKATTCRMIDNLMFEVKMNEHIFDFHLTQISDERKKI